MNGRQQFIWLGCLDPLRAWVTPNQAPQRCCGDCAYNLLMLSRYMPLKWGHLFTDPLFNSWDFLKCSFMRIVSVVQSLHCSRTYFPLTWSSMSHWILYCFSSLFNCWIYFVNSHPFAYFMWLKPSLCVVYLSLNVVAVYPMYSS